MYIYICIYIYVYIYIYIYIYIICDIYIYIYIFHFYAYNLERCLNIPLYLSFTNYTTKYLGGIPNCYKTPSSKIDSIQ